MKKGIVCLALALLLIPSIVLSEVLYFSDIGFPLEESTLVVSQANGIKSVIGGAQRVASPDGLIGLDVRPLVSNDFATADLAFISQGTVISVSPAQITAGPLYAMRVRTIGAMQETVKGLVYIQEGDLPTYSSLYAEDSLGLESGQSIAFASGERFVLMLQVEGGQGPEVSPILTQMPVDTSTLAIGESMTVKAVYLSGAEASFEFEITKEAELSREAQAYAYTEVEAIPEAPAEVLTAAPTIMPAEMPTAMPTETPIAAATIAPAEVATAAPAAIPAEVATAAPTAMPTEVPTVPPAEMSAVDTSAADSAAFAGEGTTFYVVGDAEGAAPAAIDGMDARIPLPADAYRLVGSQIGVAVFVVDPAYLLEGGLSIQSGGNPPFEAQSTAMMADYPEPLYLYEAWSHGFEDNEIESYYPFVRAADDSLEYVSLMRVDALSSEAAPEGFDDSTPFYFIAPDGVDLTLLPFEASGQDGVTSLFNVQQRFDRVSVGETAEGIVCLARGAGQRQITFDITKKALLHLDGAAEVILAPEPEAEVEAQEAQVAQPTASSEVDDESPIGTATIKADSRIRAGDSTDHDVIRTTRPGETYPVLEKTENGWYKIKLPGGEIGFISSKVCSFSER